MVDLAMTLVVASYNETKRKLPNGHLREQGLNNLLKKLFNQQTVKLFMPEN
jgi:hypothetical protein